MRYQSNFTCVVALLGVLLVAGACSTTDFEADPSRVMEIRTVAVVSFVVPKYVGERRQSDRASDLVGLARTITKYSTGGETLGNGQEAARDAAAGFIEAMARTGRWTFKPMDEVTRNPEINRMAITYNQNRNGRMAGLQGLPIIRLRMDSKPSEYARRAAEALDVDGVMMLDASDMMYVRHASVSGSGIAKGQGAGVFVLYDRSGQPVWESRTLVHETRENATMIAGVVVRSTTPKLHRSIGEAFAADLLKRYARQARR